MSTVDSADVEVRVDHPYGEMWIPLATWIEHGPGDRPHLRPVAAREAGSGAALPISVVPFRFRNTVLTRLLVRLRVMPEPWPRRAG